MVFKLRFFNRYWIKALIGILFAVQGTIALANESSDLLRSAREFYENGQYLRAARYAFSAASQNESEAYSLIAISLMKAGLNQTAVYFFIRALQSNNPNAIRNVLSQTERIISHVGSDLLRKYLVRHTKLNDYNERNQNIFLFQLGKEALLTGNSHHAVEYLRQIDRDSKLYPNALQLKATAHAVLNQGDQAIRDFKLCIKQADQIIDKEKTTKSLASDLENRCRAGLSRTYYQFNRFEEAEEEYDKIPKSSFVWTDILFEQAWNAFSQQEYNRSLGKLVSYKSPLLKFVFNPEADVLRAQSFLALCLYADANEVINEFHSKYSKVGEEVKKFVESNSSDLSAFYRVGKQAYQTSIYTENMFYKMMNRFIRTPYFQNLILSESAVAKELKIIENMNDSDEGFLGFLRQVLDWRKKTVFLLGGAFVKNSLMDYHSVLISNFEKIAFIKLEMLSRAKDRLLDRPRFIDRGRGNKEPERKSYQYYWIFNGEFWNDELGDYVFGLESDCNKN